MKNKARIGVVLLLLLTMLMTMLPVTAMAAYEVDEDTTTEAGADTPALFSMMPLNEVHKTLDLTGYLPHELKAFPVLELMSKMGMTETPAVYTRWYYYDENGDFVDPSEGVYKKITVDDTLDLTTGSSSGFYVELIGGTADQLDLTNKRYIAYIKTSSFSDYFTVDVYTKNRQKATILSEDSHYSTMDSFLEQDAPLSANYFVDLEATEWGYLTKSQENGYEYYRGLYYYCLSLNNSIAGINVKITDSNTGEDVTSRLLNQNDMTNTGGLEGDIGTFRYLTFTLWRDEGEGSTSFDVTLQVDDVMLSVDIETLVGTREVGADQWTSDVTYIKVYREHSYRYGTEYVECVLDRGFPVNGTYYCNLSMSLYGDRSNSFTRGNEYVKKAVVGNYESEAAIPTSAQDIKDKLFYNENGVDSGYGADYSNGVTFTIIDIYNRVHHIKVKTIAYEDWGGTQLSQNTYFEVYALKDFATAERGFCWLPWEDDSYYEYGYQTNFILGVTYDETERKYIYSPVTDDYITPFFWHHDQATIYASVDGGSAKKQVSGESQIPFTSGKAIQYSAVAEDGQHLANYWVTFLTQQTGGPKLFVNATNNPSHYVTVDGQQMPQREVYLSEYFNNKHDIAFANVGDATMEGLYVRLENAQNVKLDDYWTIKDTETLSAFTTTDPTDSSGNQVRYGGLANIGKIRLVPMTDASGKIITGEVSGTLVIGYTGSGTEPVEEVRINLTGFAGEPEITTEFVSNAVKYVPYSSMLQTNNLHRDADVSFSISKGTLPEGLTMKPTGEIYGVPTTPGEYKFTVKATFGSSENVTSEREYTLTVLDNTNENVLAVNDSDRGYRLLDAVPETVNMRDIPADGYVFRSEGAFGEFVAFYLDGEKLVKDQDYTAEEGSTRIVIRAQTFKNAGAGTHTIAAEFRAAGSADGEMKSTAQNVTVSGTSGSYGGRGSSTGTTATELGVTNQTSAVDVLTAAANRIAAGDMSYVTEVRAGAIKAALNKGNGITVSVEQKIINGWQVPSDDMDALNKAAGTTGSTGTYMSISIVIKDGTTGEVLGYLSQLPDSISFTAAVPQNMLAAQKNGKFIYAVRVHNGKTQFLNTSIRDGKAIFSSDQFSTYALVLMDSKVEGVKTGDPGVMLYAVLALTSYTGTALVVRGRKRK